MNRDGATLATAGKAARDRFGIQRLRKGGRLVVLTTPETFERDGARGRRMQ